MNFSKLVRNLFGEKNRFEKYADRVVEAFKLRKKVDRVFYLDKRTWVRVTESNGQIIVTPSGSEKVKVTRILGKNLDPAVGVLKFD